MHAIKPVIQLAKERALFRFSTLAERMLQDANVSLAQQIPTAGSANEQKWISASRDFLGTHGQEFLKRLNASYIGYIERGMQTMYRDLRLSLQDVSAETLSLMDDDTVTRQIEVERRVLRLRDADQQSLGRLNLMIAQLHDEHDVRERENPFRPYLMARALHDVLCAMNSNSNVCAMLFDHLSGALAEQLPEYFSAIRDVFESNGVHARLLARPSALSKREREMLALANQGAYRATAVDAGLSTGLVSGITTGVVNGFPTLHETVPASPALERVLAQLQRPGSQAGSMPVLPSDGQIELQDFVWKIFNQSAPGRIPPNLRYPDGVPNTPAAKAAGQQANAHPLFRQLQQMQQAGAPAQGGDASADIAEPVEDLREVLDLDKVSEIDRVGLDVSTMLFEYIADDEMLMPAFRSLLAQLQIPFVKAAMLDEDVLQQAGHPARQFLNRAASIASGLNASTSPGQEIYTGMAEAIACICRDFNTDMQVFETASLHLNHTVAAALHAGDAEALRAIEALENAQKNPQQHDVLVVQTVNALRERLASIETDQRAVDFLIKVWSRVLVYVSEHDSIEIEPYREVVADLLWSVQEELDASERSALMRLLPKLVQRIKTGLQLLLMSDIESKQVLDQLVAMHADVLRTIQGNQLKGARSLLSLQQHFSTLHIGSALAPQATEIHAPTVPHERLQAALQQFHVAAHLHLDSDLGTLMSSDAKWLGGMHVGTQAEWWHEGAYLPASLLWIDAAQSFYLFRINAPEARPRLLVYSSIALIKGLREGSVGMVESAPIFDRAMESLLNTSGAQQYAA
ncbi:hypothetical protein DBR37_01010 [Herminiimonas sp. KBW02]|uniref:DUF1631 family protein n=1 Tax=Herminiimonas sp. KBW02 TaxID=2153363 RepID=UPI000F5B4187|nr:DUF1631 family protein [Herminiimonas sp. KBW02]RQO38510.1 hypothetical protein DBR37_01010 [Herminiimonas sp. KBW02]